MSEGQSRPPRRNRVTPFGEFVSHSARGTLMGNRGCLTDQSGKIVRQWKLKRWIYCTLDEVHGQPVRMNDPKGYTPLFFTDEAVALAAGHRPCGSCKPEAYSRFVFAWKRLNGISRYQRITSSEMDVDLHNRRQKTPSLWGIKHYSIEELVEWCFVSCQEIGNEPLLHHAGRLWPWRHGIYASPITPNAALHFSSFPGIEFLSNGFSLTDIQPPFYRGRHKY